MDFPAVNASLNALATVLLIVGFILIKQKKEKAHKWTMLSCFLVSSIFLVCYLIYHYQKGGGTPFPKSHPSWLRITYFAILICHIILAVFVPVGAIVTIRHGLKNNRTKHLKWAKVTFPIWLYVSVTGVVVYWLLYQVPVPS